MNNLAPLMSSKSPEWYTPQDLVDAVAAFFGMIDLDPCSPCEGPEAPVPACVHYTPAIDGLAAPWFGRTFVNPPYGRKIGLWIDKAIQEAATCEIVLLVPARTDTRWFNRLAQYPRVFIRGRLRFVSPTGPKDPATFPSALVYLGRPDRALAFAKHFSAWGSCYALMEV